MAYGVIYKLTNIDNFKVYVGQTTRTVEERFKEHTRSDYPIGRAIRKDGEEKFKKEIIFVCKSQEELNSKEIQAIAELKANDPQFGYNLTAGGEGGILGYSHTEETKSILREKRIGAKNPFFGKHHTKEYSDAMSARQKGVPKPLEQVAKSAAGNRGKKRSDEAKARMGASHRGKPLSTEHCAKIAAANTGQKRTPEQCANISAGLMGHEVSDERRTNISVARRGYTPYKNLSNALTEQKISYRGLAKLMGVSHPIISIKMTGKRNFTAEDISKLAEILGKPAEYLMARV